MPVLYGRRTCKLCQQKKTLHHNVITHVEVLCLVAAELDDAALGDERGRHAVGEAEGRLAEAAQGRPGARGRARRGQAVEQRNGQEDEEGIRPAD